MANQAVLTATVQARDEASPTIRGIAKTMQEMDAAARQAASGAGAANDSFDGMDKTLKQMPEKVSRFAGGLTLVANASGMASKGMGEAAGKATFLASQIAQGGPLGIATAALTVAVSAGVAVWNVYRQQHELVTGSIQRLSPVMKAINDDLDGQSKTLSSLVDELRFYGMASRDVAIAKAQEALASRTNLPALKEETAIEERRLAQRRKEIEAIDTGSIALGFANALRVAEKNAKIDEYNNDVANLALRKQANAAGEKTIDNLHQEIALLQDLKIADTQAATAKKAHTEAVKDLADENARYEREAQAAADLSYDRYKNSLNDQKGTLAWLEDADKFKQDLNDKEIERDAKGREFLRKADEKFTRERTQAWANAANAVGDAWMSAGVAWATGQKTGSEAAKSAARDTGQMVIRAAAAKAMAEAMASYSGIPFVGIALGISAAAALSGIIMSYMTKFHTGGVVGPGDGLRLPGMQQNERAVTVQVGERFTPQGSSVGGGDGVVININSRTAFSPTSAETKRQAVQIGKVLRRQRRLGYAI